MIYVAWGYLAVHWGIVLHYLVGSTKQKTLRRDAAGLTLSHYPRVSIIVAARNEETHIEQAVRSLLQLSYPDFELLVVDDRSTDRTPAILRQLAEENPKLKVVRVDSLPPKWLGKNHALSIGAKVASGSLLLFSDADVRFSPDCVRQAVAYLETHGLDHLVLNPRIITASPFLYPVTAFFGLMFTLFFPPWKAEDPKSGVALGIGAFNLLRREAYEEIGGHDTICLRPDDDMKLGYLVKRAGFRQACLVGAEDLEVPWYDSLRAFAVGLEKNVYSGGDYHWWQIPFLSGLPFVLFVLPFFLVPFATGTAQALLLATLLLLFFSFAGVVRNARSPWWCFFFLPLAGLYVTYVLVRSVLLAEIRGGIYWRDTFYSLTTLRENRFGWSPHVKNPRVRERKRG